MATLLAIALKRRAKAPVELCAHSMVSVEAGVVGDFRGANSKNRQVTVLRSEDWADACRDIGIKLPWTIRRANLLVEGLPSLVDRKGEQLMIGDLVLQITGETEPCNRMEAAAAGLQAALSVGWRGGVTCRVIAGGDIQNGDTVVVVPSPSGEG